MIRSSDQYERNFHFRLESAYFCWPKKPHLIHTVLVEMFNHLQERFAAPTLITELEIVPETTTTWLSYKGNAENLLENPLLSAIARRYRFWERVEISTVPYREQQGTSDRGDSATLKKIFNGD